MLSKKYRILGLASVAALTSYSLSSLAGDGGGGVATNVSPQAEGLEGFEIKDGLLGIRRDNFLCLQGRLDGPGKAKQTMGISAESFAWMSHFLFVVMWKRVFIRNFLKSRTTPAWELIRGSKSLRNAYRGQRGLEAPECILCGHLFMAEWWQEKELREVKDGLEEAKTPREREPFILQLANLLRGGGVEAGIPVVHDKELQQWFWNLFPFLGSVRMPMCSPDFSKLVDHPKPRVVYRAIINPSHENFSSSFLEFLRPRSVSIESTLSKAIECLKGEFAEVKMLAIEMGVYDEDTWTNLNKLFPNLKALTLTLPIMGELRYDMRHVGKNVVDSLLDVQKYYNAVTVHMLPLCEVDGQNQELVFDFEIEKGVTRRDPPRVIERSSTLVARVGDQVGKLILCTRRNPHPGEMHWPFVAPNRVTIHPGL
jgi:hypothetical protein